ncbi:hypothetical protein BCR33DRAFT_743127 [Rhizoclosmatium globosum]|uniref:Uncharacterized protein n=1 Tax=Rhizoclosmatium globosum TaxID=329046 RepID=A0A1Y2BML5_9FUNG|nr:hypothetical protein BCR33DRAFT_743127 [Rhizoclosmatium globosum]|eukprot:ORY35999.1 hypothetical protein BCR33DRAFT_743127 [Rhizoclosmatium globosum]
MLKYYITCNKSGVQSKVTRSTFAIHPTLSEVQFDIPVDLESGFQSYARLEPLTRITRLQHDVTKTTKAVLVAQPTATQIVKDATQLNSEAADKNQDATATEVEEAEDEEDEEDADGGDDDDENDGDNDADEDDTEEDSEDNAEGEEDNTNEEADEYLPTAGATAESLGAARNVIPNDIKSTSGSVILSVGILSFTIIFMSL